LPRLLYKQAYHSLAKLEVRLMGGGASLSAMRNGRRDHCPNIFVEGAKVSGAFCFVWWWISIDECLYVIAYNIYR